MAPVCARCALRHDQKFVNRTPASVGLHYFHFPQRLADELAEIVRQIDRHDRSAGSPGIPPGDSNCFEARPRAAACALRHERGGASTPHGAAKRRFAHAGRPPASFFPARAASSAFLLRVRGARELGFHRGH